MAGRRADTDQVSSRSGHETSTSPATAAAAAASPTASTTSNVFTSHVRGHGSFSANTVRSPVSTFSTSATNPTSPSRSANGVGTGWDQRRNRPSNTTRTANAIKSQSSSQNGTDVARSVGSATAVVDDNTAIQDDDDDDVRLDNSNHTGVDGDILKFPVHRLNASGSVQAIVVDEDVLFAGLQGGLIVAWSLRTFEVMARIQAHQQSVLGLSLSEDRSLLFSSGVDSVVNVWSTQSLQRLYSLDSHFEVGDVFCVTYSGRTKTLYCGAQNSSIQWYTLESSEPSLPSGNRKHRFFDSLGPGGTPSPIPQTDGLNGAAAPEGGRLETIPPENYLQYAHKSYIYAMQIAKGLTEDDADQELLITGGGGGTIKLWSIKHGSGGRPQLMQKFKNKGSSIYSLVYRTPFLFAGLSNGVAHVYNLASRQLVQRLYVGCGDVLQMDVLGKTAICGTSEGWVKRTGSQFTEVDRWHAHHGKILATALSDFSGTQHFITGGSDNTIALWDLTDKRDAPTKSTARSNDELVNTLRQFVKYRSVANNPSYISDCHQAATFLQKQFNSFGANTSFISPGDNVNPILLAKFQATPTRARRKTILFYGHYDVVDAESSDGWQADPFTLQPLDGYLYGRGATDNKGPILAALYAVADLVQHNALAYNIVFLLEGDEEAGSRGFRAAVQQHKKAIGHVDFIMLSNSYWLDDHIPCLTFGMRGVVHASVTITSNRPDLHSGMDGKSLQHEPLKDLTVLLGGLIGQSGTEIKIPQFYDAVDELHPDEMQVYSTITSALRAGHPEIKDEKGFTKSLMQKWRDPSLTIHQIQVPESKTTVTISRSAKAALSTRIVPSQTADDVASQLEEFLRSQFAKLNSTNSLQVVITSKADPWLGAISSEIYSALKEAVMEIWGAADSTSQRSFPQQTSTSGAIQKGSGSTTAGHHRRGSSLNSKGVFTSTGVPREPLFIREGGSIPAISFLEKEFGAPAAMFPMGQASDNAHLNNERIRLENLYKGREVLKRVFSAAS